MFGSGLSALVWAGTLAPRRIALAVSIIYMLVPYHLIADFYSHGPSGVLGAGVDPTGFVLHRAAYEQRTERAGGTGNCLRVDDYQPPISVLILSPVPLAAAMVLSESCEKLRNLCASRQECCWARAWHPSALFPRRCTPEISRLAE